MKLSDLNKAIADTEKAQKSVTACYGEHFAKSLFAAALNQMAHSYLHLESNKKYEGMSDEEIALVKEAEREEEMAAAQEEMKERLKVAYKIPELELDEPLQEEASDESDSVDVRPEPNG